MTMKISTGMAQVIWHACAKSFKDDTPMPAIGNARFRIFDWSPHINMHGVAVVLNLTGEIAALIKAGLLESHGESTYSLTDEGAKHMIGMEFGKGIYKLVDKAAIH